RLETASAGGWGAGGLEFGGRRVGRVWTGSGYWRIDGWQREGRELELRVCPLGSGDGPAAIVVTTAGIAEDQLCGFCDQGTVAGMGGFANTACMGWRSDGRQRRRDQSPHEREEEQQSCGQAMHACCMNRNPKGQASIEQKRKSVQGRVTSREGRCCPQELRLIQAAKAGRILSAADGTTEV